MNGLLLDTHILIWYVLGQQSLSIKVRKIINQSSQSGEVFISAISLWEVAMLAKKKRVILSMPCLEWLNKTLHETKIKTINLSPKIAVESCCLPGNFHADPADRLIVATARIENLSLLTYDKNIICYAAKKFVCLKK